jgi:hypothetical protein
MNVDGKKTLNSLKRCEEKAVPRSRKVPDCSSHHYEGCKCVCEDQTKKKKWLNDEKRLGKLFSLYYMDTL